MFDFWRGMAEINDATKRLKEATDQTLGVLGGSSSSFWGIRMMRLEDVKAGALIQGLEPGVVIAFLGLYTYNERVALMIRRRSRGAN